MSDREERKRRETQKKRDNAKVYCIYKENEYTKRNTKTEEISTEEILYITLHSDSDGADNTQILISNFGFETTVKNIEINLELDGN